MSIEFKKWPKIPHWDTCKWHVTEKIDGTNACVVIKSKGISRSGVVYDVAAQSRQRLITPQDDNFGFAQWVEDNKEELVKLGEGYHYGEWWGKGIQRGYGLEERRFSLFDWWREGEDLPTCCYVVPILGTVNHMIEIQGCWDLIRQGSKAVSGWRDPEGYIVINRDNPKLMYKSIIRK